jgi:hypothetical protein
MTFARGNIRGYDDDRMVLLFSMMDDGREVLRRQRCGDG